MADYTTILLSAGFQLLVLIYTLQNTRAASIPETVPEVLPDEPLETSKRATWLKTKKSSIGGASENDENEQYTMDKTGLLLTNAHQYNSDNSHENQQKDNSYLDNDLDEKLSELRSHQFDQRAVWHPMKRYPANKVPTSGYYGGFHSNGDVFGRDSRASWLPTRQVSQSRGNAITIPLKMISYCILLIWKPLE